MGRLHFNERQPAHYRDVELRHSTCLYPRFPTRIIEMIDNFPEPVSQNYQEDE